MSSKLFLIFSLFVVTTQAAKGLPSTVCNRFDKVIVHHRDYFNVYLGMNMTTGKLDEEGRFYRLLQHAIPACCRNVKLEFVYENTTKDDMDTIALRHISEGSDNATRVLTFFFPEFAEHKDQTVYDFELKFVKLSRSPGQAIVMLKPPPQKRVYLYDIFIKSAPILLFLIALSWAVGILGWMTDHWKNPEEFPNPFIKGMFEGLWWSVVTMTTVGYGDKAPKSVPARILSIIWVLVSAVLLSLFTANATAILNASQQKVDYSKTIGKTIGVLQSKHFDEFYLNMGAHVINYDNFFNLNSALLKGKIDRFLFPNYKDLLLYFSGAENKRVTNKYKIVKIFDSPFQIGMVLARTPESLESDDNLFLKCLKTSITHDEKLTNEGLGYSEAVYPKQESDEELGALNQDNLILLTYYILAIIAGLIVFGLTWDVWRWCKNKKIDNREDDTVGSLGQVNGTAAPVTTTEPDQATWF